MTQVTTSEPSVATLTCSRWFPRGPSYPQKRFLKATGFLSPLNAHQIGSFKFSLPAFFTFPVALVSASLSHSLVAPSFHPWLSFLLLLLLKISPSFFSLQSSLVTFSKLHSGFSKPDSILSLNIISKQIHTEGFAQAKRNILKLNF